MGPVVLPLIALSGGCTSCCTPEEPSCEDPRLWYAPTSDEVVEFGCEPPAPGWRPEPFFAEVGPDLDGRLRGEDGIFEVDTSDTAELPSLDDVLGPLSAVRDPELPPPPTGDTLETGLLLGTGSTADTAWIRDTATLGPPLARAAGTDTAEPSSAAGDTRAADTGRPSDTAGVLDTGLPTGDTFAPLTGDTAAPLGDTMATADTGPPPLPDDPANVDDPANADDPAAPVDPAPEETE